MDSFHQYLRKRYETAIFILISQILNFFIVRFPISIFTNFIVTGIASIFTSKSYLNYLVEYKKFIPYTIWKKVNLEDEDIERKITINKRKNRRIVAISIAFILFTSLTSLGFTYKDVIGSIITSSNSQMKVKNYAIITVNSDKFESILILNSKNNNDLEGIVYPGKIQVKMNNKIDELNKLVNIKDIETLKNVIKDNFAIQISDYILINKDDIKSSDNIKAVDLYKDIFTGLFELSESDFNNKVKEIQKKYPDIDKLLVKEFYDNFKDSNVNISNLKYEIVLLGDILDGEILQALNLSNKANYKFLTVDKRILQNNELVKNINKKYNEYLEKEKKDLERLEEPIWNEDDELQEQNGGGSGEIITPPSNSGGTGRIHHHHQIMEEPEEIHPHHHQIVEEPEEVQRHHLITEEPEKVQRHHPITEELEEIQRHHPITEEPEEVQRHHLITEEPEEVHRRHLIMEDQEKVHHHHQIMEEPEEVHHHHSITEESEGNTM